MKVTIYLNPAEQASVDIRDIRSQQTHNLLATCDAAGVWLFDRRSREHYLLSWAELADLQRQALGEPKPTIRERPMNPALDIAIHTH